MGSVVKSSVLNFCAEKIPNTGVLSRVCPWVVKNKGNPGDDGANVTPVTQGVKEGTLAARDKVATVPPVKDGALVPADVNVWAFSPVDERRGSSPTVPTSPIVTKVPIHQCQNTNVANATMLTCETSQNHQCTLNPLQSAAEDTSVPGTEQYSVYLPSGTPPPPPL